MSNFTRAALAATALVCVSGIAPAIAQDEPEPVVDALVVTAAQPGPPWWRVSRGESEVYILGTPMAVVPNDLSWDQSVLKRRLQGAKSVILPSSMGFSLTDAGAMLRMYRAQSSKVALEPDLPESLRARFVAARVKLGQPASRYQNLSLRSAGERLIADYRDRHGFVVNDTIVFAAIKVAGAAKVKPFAMRRKAGPLVNSVLDALNDPRKAQACFTGYLDAVEFDPARFRAAAAGWARGDARAALDVPEGPFVCNRVLTADYQSQRVTDQVEAISQALNTPGRSIAIVPLRILVIKDGVIQQLAARGFEITDPSSLRD